MTRDRPPKFRRVIDCWREPEWNNTTVLKGDPGEEEVFSKS